MVKVGKGGIANYKTQHKDTPKCQSNLAKRTKFKPKPMKTKENGSLLSFLKPRNAAASKPSGSGSPQSASSAAASERSHRVPNLGSSQTVSKSSGVTPVPQSKLPFILRFRNLVLRLPGDLPQAAPDDRLAVFSNPRAADNPHVQGGDLWEEVLNGLMKEALGWGPTASMEGMMKRGIWGLDGLADFVEYFVEKRGVDIVLFEGKLARLMLEIEKW